LMSIRHRRQHHDALSHCPPDHLRPNPKQQ
jgi:hypothetical protein